MKHLHHHLMLATALAAGMIVAAPLASGQVRAEESATVTTNPGFKPDTGQINPGVTKQAPSQSTEVIKLPTPEEVRAAKMMPVSTQPSLGNGPQAGGANSNAVNAAPALPAQQPAAAITGAASSEIGGTVSPVGSGSSAAAEPPPSGPIGSTGQTEPAKFSKRNDILDRVPIMAMPLPLSDQQRQQIYQAVMADKSQPAADADALAPASELSTNQALNEMHELPASVRDIAATKGLKYVKAKGKVLLVTPSTRTVIEQITS
ncbi:MAG TPA: hypothetical protein VII24_08215 [Pseudolabrys sp.]|jgi:hypothetical protein